MKKELCQKLMLAIESENYAISTYKKVAKELIELDKDLSNSQFFINLANEEEIHNTKLREKSKELGC